MKKLSLPKIESGNQNYSLPKKDHSFSNPFHSRLKKYKLKKLNLDKVEAMKNNGKYLLTEPYSNNNFDIKINSDSINKIDKMNNSKYKNLLNELQKNLSKHFYKKKKKDYILCIIPLF